MIQKISSKHFYLLIIGILFSISMQAQLQIPISNDSWRRVASLSEVSGDGIVTIINHTKGDTSRIYISADYRATHKSTRTLFVKGVKTPNDPVIEKVRWVKNGKDNPIYLDVYMDLTGTNYFSVAIAPGDNSNPFTAVPTLSATIPEFYTTKEINWDGIEFEPIRYASILGISSGDGSPTNELQNLSISGSNLSISKGNTVTLEDYHPKGNTWYVSPDGNNSTAEKGNPTKPFADPWRASRDSQVQGEDLIHVMPGTYSPSGSGVSTSSQDSVNLWSHLNWYFDQGAEIVMTGIAPHFHLWYDDSTSHTTVKQLNVLGFGKFTETQTNAWIDRAIVKTLSKNTFVNFHADVLDWSTHCFTACSSYQNRTTGGGNFVVNINQHRLSNGQANSQAILFMEIGRYNQGDQEFSDELYVNAAINANQTEGHLFKSNCCGDNIVVKESNISFQINKVKVGNVTTYIDLGDLISFVHDTEYDHSLFSFKLGTIIQKQDNPASYPDEGRYINPRRNIQGFSTMVGFGASFTDTEVKIDCENCQADIPWFRPSGTYGAENSVRSNIYINGLYQSNVGHTIVLDNFGNGADGLTYHFDGIFRNTYKNVVVDLRNGSGDAPNVNFSGTYETTGDDVVFAVRQPLNLVNAVLRNPNSTEPSIFTDAGSNINLTGTNVHANNAIGTNITIVPGLTKLD
jgi:hypothetical protein